MFRHEHDSRISWGLDLICDVYWMRLLDEATAKLDLEAVNGHRVDEELPREVLSTDQCSHVFVTSCVKLYLSLVLTGGKQCQKLNQTQTIYILLPIVVQSNRF